MLKYHSHFPARWVFRHPWRDVSSNVLGLTALSASQKISDPRDHIYAKLSLADDAQARHIVPNYRKDAA